MLEDGNPDFSVVYRTIPTSNHNVIGYETREVQVVYRTIPTSNHNWYCGMTEQDVLYIVLFLHQTTTPTNVDYWRAMSDCPNVR